ncbi:MAG: hypothetical protein ACPGXK_06780 [Phycisphaerae bacterium]
MKTLKVTLAALMVATMFNIAPVALADGGSIKGKVIFSGDAGKFKRKRINTAKDPVCAQAGRIGTYDVVINKKTDPTTLRNVMVYIKSGLSGSFDAPAEKVQLTQVKCEYTPHVLGLMAGQTLTISNGDATNHNIHFLPKVNEEINFSQPKKGMTKDIQLVKEDVFKIKCDVHPWMAAYIQVFDHPFFAVTGKDGTFELKGVPAGKYVVEAWHEKFGVKTVEVTVASTAAEADFTYTGEEK